MSGSVLKVTQEGDVLRCISSSDPLDSVFVAGYFRLEEDLDRILATFTKDGVLSRAIQRFYGLRLIKQDPWECLASFVLATNANIPRIAKMVSAICEKYGRSVEFDGESFALFPEPTALAGATVGDLRKCGLGYRASFLKRVATSVVEGKVDFAQVSALKYEDSRKELLKELFGEKVLLGVGPKVADCVLLYSCGKDEAFPIDVWITKVLRKSYPRLFLSNLNRRVSGDQKGKLSPSGYAKLSNTVRAHFGQYAGYAQQYLFVAAREEGRL